MSTGQGSRRQGVPSFEDDRLAGEALLNHYDPTDLGNPTHSPVSGSMGSMGESEKSMGSVGVLKVVWMNEVRAMTTTYVIDGLVPRDDLTVLVGEEGIGKGLWWIRKVAERSRRGKVTAIVTPEDDYNRTVRPRLDAAGADLTKVAAIVLDRETMTGVPLLPLMADEVSEVIRQTGADLLLIDPWVSVVPGGLRLRDTQDARAAIDPLTAMARRLHIGILAVAHTNRGPGSLRDRVSLTAVLRQAARVLLYAMEDPGDDSILYVGVEKANGMKRGPAVKFIKSWCPHPVVSDAYQVDGGEETDRTIRAWDETFAPADGRTSDKWPAVKAKADKGVISRVDVVGIYDGNEKSADAALSRWVHGNRLERVGPGVYELAAEA